MKTITPEEIVKKILNGRFTKIQREKTLYHLFKENTLLTYLESGVKKAKSAQHRNSKRFKETINKIKRIRKGREL